MLLDNSPTGTLLSIHESLCHPGVTRLHHFIRSKNLPYSIEELRRVVSSCKVCRENKPRFFKPAAGRLIKATQSMERLNIDFKGPLPSCNKNRYFLTVVDEYSRFPFIFPCEDLSSSTVIKCLTQLFVLCGMPAFIHSDRGSAFMSSDLREFLTSRGVASSRPTSWNPTSGEIQWCNVEGHHSGLEVKRITDDALASCSTRCTPLSALATFYGNKLDSTRALLQFFTSFICWTQSAKDGYAPLDLCYSEDLCATLRLNHWSTKWNLFMRIQNMPMSATAMGESLRLP